MSIIEIIGQRDELTRQQRWSNFLTFAVALVALAYGLNLRNASVNATTLYTDVRAGIRVSYPVNWLIDQQGDYVFRVRDTSRIGFKTTILIQTRPIAPNTTARAVLDSLNINRPLTLASYVPLSREDILLPDDTLAVSMNYTFVNIETNPFLESFPIVVAGRDILTIRGGQAILITFRTDASTFDKDLAIFNRFLNSLEFS